MKPNPPEPLTDDRIQKALTPLALDNVLRYTYPDGKVVRDGKWNVHPAFTQEIEYQRLDAVFADQFKEIADTKLRPYGRRVAFVALLPINESQYTGLGNVVKNPVYDPNGTAVAMSVGVWGVYGVLQDINPTCDWISVGKYNSASTMSKMAAFDAVYYPVNDKEFFGKLLARYLPRVRGN